MSFEEWEKQFMRRIKAQGNELSRIFNEFISEASPILTRYKAVEKGGVWARNKAIEKQLKRKLQGLQAKLQSFILKETGEAWEMANQKTDEFVNRFIKGLPISESVRSGLFYRNMEALKEFQKRRVGKMNLSQRVWSICDQTKQNIEYYLQSGIGTGRSAAQMSRDVRQLLNNPDKRFRRIRDPKTGKLKLSKPMKAYHPGRGVYRSAYQNALRMTRTETNMAYRLSDQARWEKLEFITGYEVKRSAVAVPCELCDSLKGEYPKTFVFGGWHPSCYCYTVPIMLKQDQFVEYLETGKAPMSEYVKRIPKQAREYVMDNSERFLRYSDKPYWIRDNFKLQKGKFIPAKEIAITQDEIFQQARFLKFGKYKGEDVYDVVKKDAGYGGWLFENAYHADLQDHARLALQKYHPATYDKIKRRAMAGYWQGGTGVRGGGMRTGR